MNDTDRPDAGSVRAVDSLVDPEKVAIGHIRIQRVVTSGVLMPREQATLERILGALASAEDALANVDVTSNDACKDIAANRVSLMDSIRRALAAFGR